MGLVNVALCTALAQQNDAAISPGAPSPPSPPPPAPPALAPSVPSASGLDPAAAANAAASLPPPAALPGSTMQSLSADNALSNLGRSDFVRGIWVDANGPALRTPEGVKKLVADCREAGFDTIYAQVRAVGDALYNTTLAPKQRGLDAGFDPLKALLEEAKAGGQPLEVHALLVAFRVWRGSSEAPDGHVMKQHADWVTQSDDGNRQMAENEIWLDPGIVAVQDHLALIATDLVKNYAVDGIQLDRIRYPELDRRQYPNGTLRVGYAPAAVERYNQEKGKSGQPAPNDREWIDWRRDQVTATVRKIREAVKAIRPNAIISAGAITFGKAPRNRDDYMAASDPYKLLLEDWVGWCESGLLDVNVLMNFKAADRNGPEFYGWQNFAMANKGKAKVVIGVGGWLNPPRHAGALMLGAIFRPEADGVALYGYGDTFRDRENDGNIALLKPILDTAGVNAKAGEVTAALAQPSADIPSVITKLDSLGGLFDLPAVAEPAPTAVATATTPSPAMPPLPSAATAAPAAGMPSLAVAAASQDPTVGLPTLPGTAQVEASVPAGLPALPPTATVTIPSLPSLMQTDVQIAAAPMGDLPALPSSTSPDAASAISGLPSLANAAAPATDPSTGVAIADITPAAQPVVPQLPDLVSPISPANPMAIPGATLPGLDTFPAGTAPLSADVAVTLEPPLGTPITSVAPVVPGPPTTSLMAPATEVRTSVFVPQTGGQTNFDGMPLATPVPASPVITPPTVITPAPGQTNEAQPINVGKEVVLDRPQLQRPDYSEHASPYGTPNPPYEIRNFTTANIRRERKDFIAMPAAPEQLEIIVLRTGKEFAGRVLQRGTTWRIQLPNGSILNLPGDRIATVRSATSPAQPYATDPASVPML